MKKPKRRRVQKPRKSTSPSRTSEGAREDGSDKVDKAHLSNVPAQQASLLSSGPSALEETPTTTPLSDPGCSQLSPSSSPVVHDTEDAFVSFYNLQEPLDCIPAEPCSLTAQPSTKACDIFDTDDLFNLQPSQSPHQNYIVSSLSMSHILSPTHAQTQYVDQASVSQLSQNPPSSLHQDSLPTSPPRVEGLAAQVLPATSLAPEHCCAPVGLQTSGVTFNPMPPGIEDGPFVCLDGDDSDEPDELFYFDSSSTSSEGDADEQYFDFCSGEDEDDVDEPEVEAAVPEAPPSDRLCDCGCKGPYHPERTGAYYKAHLHLPLYKDAELTTMEMLYAMLTSLETSSIPRDTFDSLCLFLSEKSLPKPNYMPPSAHIIKTALGVEDWSAYEVHVCENPDCPGFRWERSGDAYVDLQKHKDDTCPRCGERRFNVTMTEGGKEVIKPQGYCIDFGLKSSLQDMFSDRALVEDLLQRDPDAAPEPGSYHASPEAERLQLWLRSYFKDPSFKLASRDNVRFDILTDWLQPWGSVAYSVGFLSVRCCDVSPRNLGKAGSSRIVVVIPGPKIPQNMKPYIMGLLGDFAQGLDSKLQLKTNVPGHDSISIRPLLTGFLADSPARCKYSEFMNVGAKYACGWCLYQGVPHKNKVGNNSTMYYPGYLTPLPQEKFEKEEMTVGHEDLYLSDEQQLARAVEVEAGSIQPNVAGCRGVSIVCKMLPYVSYNNLWIIPVAHALLYGLVKELVCHLLRAPKFKECDAARNLDPGEDFIDSKGRKLMEARAKHIHVTSDFGRSYKCVLKYMNSYKLEDWFHFVETFSPYIFRGVLPPKMQSLWACLVEVVTFFMRPSCCEDQASFEAACDAASNTLRVYANSLELAGFPASTFTYNMHMLVCRLGRQVQWRGSSAHELEFVVEREVQVFKRGMGRRVCIGPERTFANKRLAQSRLHFLGLDHPTLKTMEQHTASTKSVAQTGGAYDDGHEAEDVGHEGRYKGGAVLVGKGKAVSHPGVRAKLYAHAEAYVSRVQPQGWGILDVQTSAKRTKRQPGYTHSLLTYSRAECNEDFVTALGLGAGDGTRVNHWVLVNYEDETSWAEEVSTHRDESQESESESLVEPTLPSQSQTTADSRASTELRTVPHVAKVRMFFRLIHPHHPDTTPLRLAVCDIYRAVSEARLLRVNVRNPSKTNCVVPIGDIDGKLVAFLKKGAVTGYFIRPMNMTTRS